MKGSAEVVVLTSPQVPGRTVTVRLAASGDVRFEGQDLQPGLPEYEWVATVRAAQAPTLLAAVGVASGPELLRELELRREQIVPGAYGWLRGLGLMPELWTHRGDD